MAHRNRHRRSGREDSFFVRVGGLILGGAGLLTLVFFGMVAIAASNTPGIGGRIPFYVLGTAVVFVGGIMVLERKAHRPDGERVLWAASTLALFGFVLLSLAGEGVLYVAQNPGTALAPDRFLYIAAAGFVGSGVSYWGLRQWQGTSSWGL